MLQTQQSTLLYFILILCDTFSLLRHYQKELYKNTHGQDQELKVPSVLCISNTCVGEVRLEHKRRLQPSGVLVVKYTQVMVTKCVT
jgi:hypothetical protein